jgi:hypothetical protein
MHRAITSCLTAPLVLLGCSYDFDQFARTSPTGSAADAAGSGGSGGIAAGSGGSGGLDDASVAGGAGGVGDASADAAGGQPATGGATGDVDANIDSRIVDATLDTSLDTGTGYCDAVAGTMAQGHCYYVNKAKAKWNSGLCTAVSGFHLVTITSAAEQATVDALINPADQQDYWMGLAEPAGTYTQKKETNFEWVTAPAEHYDPATSYRHWYSWTDADHEPNFAPTPTGGCTPIDCWPDCVRVRSTGDWSDGPCGDALWSICEHD